VVEAAAPAIVKETPAPKDVVAKEAAPAAAVGKSKPVEKPVEKESAASRNHKLISSLIGAPPRQ
jgi:hypothetical protein